MDPLWFFSIPPEQSIPKLEAFQHLEEGDNFLFSKVSHMCPGETTS